MKSSWKLVIIVLLAIALVWWYRARGGDAPDGQLAKHFDNVCHIAGDNVETPLRGVNKLFKYTAKNGPTMLKEFGETLVAIERIRSDDAHDQRARVARDRMWAPLRSCESTFERFFTAVAEDPEASARAERGFDRFARTLEILFGADRRALQRQLGAMGLRF